MSVDKYLTHIDYTEDLQYLRNKLPDVNMRLFHSSDHYRRIIQGCCNYLSALAKTTMDGYKKPHGMSGANIGIPFNIIGVVKNRNKDNETVEIMINPKIVKYSNAKTVSMSNCGSIRLPEPIAIERSNGVIVDWYDINGKPQHGVFTRDKGGFTIQHEIDHNNGVLITDRKISD